MKNELILGIFLLAAALISLVLLQWKKPRSAIYSSAAIYQDISPAGKPVRALFDQKSGLAGKPDLILKQGDQFIPVEIKSMPAPPQPYETHVLQLMAYCYLVEQTFGVRPDYGILRYRNKEENISYTINKEKKLHQVLDQIRLSHDQPEIHRSHSQPARCRSCGYRDECEEKL